MVEHPGDRLRQGAAVLVPLAMPLAMKAVFRASTRRFGSQRGYQAGSAVYRATCWGVAAALVGPRRLAALWHPGNTELPDPPFLAAMVLAVPPLGAITTQWLPNARDAGPVGIAAAAGVGITNALAQEALWRGVPVSLFPGLLSGAGSGPPWASPPGTMCLSPPSQPAAHGARPFLPVLPRSAWAMGGSPTGPAPCGSSPPSMR
jgi:hypothetical protein